ncbi:MAG: PDDEXK nuclease domain-containing protein [Clostridia bacterium]
MLINQENYFNVLENIKSHIYKAQYKAILGANREQIILFWNIGKIINENNSYGSSFVENLAKDIKSEFPNSKGYSVRNLRYMRKFAEMFEDIQNLQVPLADLTWYHLQTLMDKTSDNSEYIWYANKVLKNGWSRNILLHQIETRLYQRQTIAEKTDNFSNTLVSPHSELAKSTIKNPYIFDFIDIRDDIIEREIENELVSNIAKTLIELGTGFDFLGNQYHLNVGNEDYYLDLLFYKMVIYLRLQYR